MTGAGYRTPVHLITTYRYHDSREKNWYCQNCPDLCGLSCAGLHDRGRLPHFSADTVPTAGTEICEVQCAKTAPCKRVVIRCV